MVYPIEVETRLARWRTGAEGLSRALATQAASDWTSARQAYETAFLDMFSAPAGVELEDVEIAGIPTLIACPAGGKGMGRTILYLHGGGYASGSAKAYGPFAAHLALHMHAKIVVPDYRLAPQHPFPAAIEDGLAVYRVLLESEANPCGLSVAGDSAGAAMALTVLRRARDSGLPMPASCLALSPWADLQHTGSSAVAKAERDPLVRLPFLRALAEAYCGGADLAHPDISPIHADFTGLPPTHLQVGEREVMLSDTLRLAERLAHDGVKVSLEVWPEMFHVFPLFAGLLPQADEALRSAAAFHERASKRSLGADSDPHQQRKRKDPTMDAITRLNPPTLTDFGSQGFSHISITEPGRMAYISGQVAWSVDGGEVPDDLVEQIRVIGRNVRHALEAIGASPHDVVVARFYVTDLTPERLALLMEPLRDIFEGAQPSLTGIGVAALAGPGLQAELELTVRLPAETS